MHLGNGSTGSTSYGGIELPPIASVLMESLRSVGYTAAAALADLVDNSIAARARTIRISFSNVPTPYVAIADDGTGMDEPTLISAMRFGSRDPRLPRDARDLGRFGLGLKTASLSQCRRVSVATFSAGKLLIARWDLDECDRRRSWWLERPSAQELPRETIAILERHGRGTAVIWEKLDRLQSSGAERVILDAADHLSLVFHRFLSGEIAGPFTILLNERALPIIDPFLQGHARGQALHPETVLVDGHPVEVSPFVLPFPSRLNPRDLDLAGGRDSLKTAHGFYVYRGGRLVVPGGWFRIVPADDLVRLARIRVDVPVELDHLWKLDIRKTVVEPPQLLRPHLRRIVGAVASRSRKVFTHRGIPTDDFDRVALWKRHDLRDGAAAWLINREHPLVRWVLAENPGAVRAKMLLSALENTLPIHDIHIHTANDQPIAEPPVPEEAELESMARNLMGAFADLPEAAARLLESLPITEPFNRNPEATQRIVEKLRG